MNATKREEACGNRVEVLSGGSRKHTVTAVKEGHILDLGTEMAGMSGAGIPELCTECQF